jgi:alkylated DNA repair protein (DNA oxidative demethylase)
MTSMTIPVQGESSGLRLIPGFLDREAQDALMTAVRDIVRQAPLFTPRMPATGKPFSVRMTNCGPLGWVSDAAGYRYEPAHPTTGAPWPPMPEILVRSWFALSDYPAPPQACLVNYYDAQARMGLHQDRDEDDFSAPVISFSLGTTCRFRMGGSLRTDRTRSFLLASGDVLVMAALPALPFTALTAS